jgi:hypothetical protein
MRIPLLPPPGLNSDDTAFAQPMRYIDLDNVRFIGGKPQPIGGWTKYFSDQITGICRNVLAWYDLDGALNIAIGTHTNLYVYVGGALNDITPVGLAAGAENGAGGSGFGAGDYGEGDYGEGNPVEYFPRTWSLDTWGENLIASPREGTIYVWENDPAQVATVIANAPDRCTAVMVTPERQIIALGCNEESSGTFNSRCIRGCNIGDYDDWTTSSNDNVFEHILEGTGGNVVSGRMVGEYVGVWTDRGLFMGEFIGAADETYRFTLQTSNAGLRGPNAVQIYQKRAWWLSPDYQFFTWAPGEAPALVPCPIRDDFRQNIAAGQFDKIAATSISQYGEIWWFYPDSRDGTENSRYVSISTAVAYGQPFVWSRGTLARSACTDSGPTRNPIFIGADGFSYSHEDGFDANGSALNWSFTISLPSLDEGGRFIQLSALEPDILDQMGAVTFSLALRKYPASTARTKGPFTIGVGAERKHFLASGRVAEITFSGNSAPSYARFGKPVLIGVATGAE